ncbi:hypothetical protein [Campylobacter troglodytis]|uniref:hypothetical protein n=1 Tax=Campylobacter troglodytis TaxID=654363 RepID=UPI0011588F18|nr:hypothetical protein [Campylobacter troglodytis]TQR53111.1 hypothetical protein DMC01_12020 [Campylobacter troglodytis]
MKGAIFEREEIPFWQKIHSDMEAKEARFQASIPPNTDEQQHIKEYRLNFILKTLKSYKLHPSGNGIKWSNEEKESFVKLSYKEQRKMIVRKSELKSSLFPYVTVDYEPYKYSERISDSAKRVYQKAQSLLNQNKNLDFSNLDFKIKEEIFNNLRLSYKEGYLKAGVELAKLLFKNSHLRDHKNAGNEIAECSSITQALLDEKIPENAYMYYQLYKNGLLYLGREQALECYNYALESIVWEAIDEETQREESKYSLISAELWLAAAIKYQSPLAFSMAASNYCPTGVPMVLMYALIPFHACVRCNIALGGGAINTLIENYRLSEGDFPRSYTKAAQLEAYKKKTALQKGLINELDPYFDEKFPPESLIDLSSFAQSCVYGGRKGSLGIAYAKKIGLMKDVRDKDSTPQSIKEYYLMMWRIIVADINGFKRLPKLFDSYRGYITHQIYENLQYGYPSARPYIFPKEVLDLEIDFTRGVEDLKQGSI